MECTRAVISDPVNGQITVDHNPTSGVIFVEFERLETSDSVMPQYRISLSTEHVAAWAESLLTRRGRRCRQCGGVEEGKRLSAMLRLTGSDPDLVFYTHSGPNVILVRGGRVLKVPFEAQATMASFLARMKEEDCRPEHHQTCSAEGFVAYIQGLMI